ncbi:MAG: hypothetical protein AAF937_07405 [Planctomycetota bacterium]
MLKAFAACAAMIIAGSAVAQTSIRYDFELEVIGNSYPATGASADLGALPLGTAAFFSLEASTQAIPGLGTASDSAASYPTLGTSLVVGGVDLQLDQSLFPSGSLFDSVQISNDAPSVGDGLALVTSSMRPDVALTVFLIATLDDPGSSADLWPTADLPTSIDVASIAPRSDLVFSSPDGSGLGSMSLQVRSVEITVIPTPAGTTALAGALLFVRRRRRI